MNSTIHFTVFAPWGEPESALVNATSEDLAGVAHRQVYEAKGRLTSHELSAVVNRVVGRCEAERRIGKVTVRTGLNGRVRFGGCVEYMDSGDPTAVVREGPLERYNVTLSGEEAAAWRWRAAQELIDVA